MPKSIWSGFINFGLVNVPVKLEVATHDKTVHFHMIHEKDGGRVHQKLVCPVEDEEVSRDEVVKGYEVSPGQYVTVKQSELDSLSPDASRNIDILDFVDMEEIDPIYYQKAYYLVPREESGKAYGLLVMAMEEQKKVGIGKFVMRNKEYLAALRPIDGVICLETMHFHDEVMVPSQLDEAPEPVQPSSKELKMARQLIDTLSEPFEPEKYHDEFREKVMGLIKSKEEGKEIVTEPSVREPGEVVDLASALEESLKRAKKKEKKEAS